MKFNMLNEDTFDAALKREIAGVDQQLDGDIVVEHQGDIEKALDKCYRANRKSQRRGGDFLSVLLIGQAGTGKTQRVIQWCKDKGLHLVSKDAKSMDIADLGGIYAPNADTTRAINLPNGAFDELNKPDTVLFLDEFNRANSQVRFTLAQLIDEHKIPDSSEEGGYHYFHNLVLVVAAINPAEYGVYNTDPLDAAELSRFRQVNVRPDKVNQLQYYTRYFKEQIAQDIEEEDDEERLADERRLNLATRLMKSKDFEFDDPEDEVRAVEKQQPILNPRTLTRLLHACDGTKDDFLDEWDAYCNPEKKVIAERILSDYVDIDDKANSVFKNKGVNNPFAQKNPRWQTIQNKIEELGL